MTCKNCIYEPMCHNVIAYGMDTDDVTATLITDIEKHCKHFKDKSRVIVPPCKVGDTVYVICNKMVQETTVFSMRVETEDKNYVFYIKALAVDGMNKTVHGYATVFKIFVFGKTAFLTREEAEQALAERGGINAGNS